MNPPPVVADRVLVVDDEPEIVALVAYHLAKAGYRVSTASSGQDAIELARRERPALLVLDLMLPGMSGFDVLESLRAEDQTRDLAVLMLTARREEVDRIRGLSLGADDYLTKPFDKRELMARIQAIVRRSKGHAQSIIKTGPITVNLDARTVEVDNKQLHLTSKEYGIIELLSLRKGSTLTKEMFLNHLYGGMDEPEVKIIDVFICKLRKKIEKISGEGGGCIETVWGRGYVLRDPAGSPQKETASG